MLILGQKILMLRSSSSHSLLPLIYHSSIPFYHLQYVLCNTLNLPGECHFVRGTPGSILGQLMMLSPPATSGSPSLRHSGWGSLVCGCSCGRRRPLDWFPSLPLHWLLTPEGTVNISAVVWMSDGLTASMATAVFLPWDSTHFWLF